MRSDPAVATSESFMMGIISQLVQYMLVEGGGVVVHCAKSDNGASEVRLGGSFGTREYNVL